MSRENERRPAGHGAAQETAGEDVNGSVARTVWQREIGAERGPVRERPVGRIDTVISQQPWFRYASIDRRRQLVATLVEARKACHDRKMRVKAHPDLADRLTRALGYSRFDQWTGYVPATRLAAPLNGYQAINDSPVRAALFEILAEVVEREKTARRASLTVIHGEA